MMPRTVIVSAERDASRVWLLTRRSASSPRVTGGRVCWTYVRAAPVEPVPKAIPNSWPHCVHCRSGAASVTRQPASTTRPAAVSRSSRADHAGIP
jgi:hypothetical protein